MSNVNNYHVNHSGKDFLSAQVLAQNIEGFIITELAGRGEDAEGRGDRASVLELFNDLTSEMSNSVITTEFFLRVVDNMKGVGLVGLTNGRASIFLTDAAVKLGVGR
jgi:hypothetical protein